MTRLNTAATSAAIQDNDLFMRKLAEPTRTTRLDVIAGEFTKIGMDRLGLVDRNWNIKSEWVEPKTAAEQHETEIAQAMLTAEGRDLIKKAMEIGRELGDQMFSADPEGSMDIAKTAELAEPEPIDPSAPGSLLAFIKTATVASTLSGLTKDFSVLRAGGGALAGGVIGGLASTDPDDTTRNVLMGAALGGAGAHVYGTKPFQKMIGNGTTRSRGGKKPASAPKTKPAAAPAPAAQKPAAGGAKSKPAAAAAAPKPTAADLRAAAAAPVIPAASPVNIPKIVPATGFGNAGREAAAERMKAVSTGVVQPSISDIQHAEDAAAREAVVERTVPVETADEFAGLSKKEKRSLRNKKRNEMEAHASLDPSTFEKLASIMKSAKKGGPVSVALGAAVPAAMQIAGGATEIGDVLAPALGGAIAARQAGMTGVLEGAGSSMMLRHMKNDPGSMLSKQLSKIEDPEMRNIAHRMTQVGLPASAAYVGGKIRNLDL